MSRMFVAGIFSVMLVVSVIMGAYSMASLPRLDGFTDADLHAPGQFTGLPLLPLPGAIASDIVSKPDIAVMIYIGQIFTDYGGSVRLEVTNNDSRAIFLEEVSFCWVGETDSFQVSTNQLIEPGEIYLIKSLAIDGPAIDGTHEYQIKMHVLQLRNNQWFRIVSRDDDWLAFTEHTIDVQSLSGTVGNEITRNPRKYFVKLNDLVDFDSEAVAGASENATAGIGIGYNIGKVCAIYDWLDTNINYTEDPGGGDSWYSPDKTLTSLKGDCEDYAMLLAAMVEHIGGTSRVYLTEDHAFAAVYVGNTSQDLSTATAGVRTYYRTDVETHVLADETGYWMVADPLGSLNMGGLAVGQSPTAYYDGQWNTTFEDTKTLYAIDVTGVDMSPSIWLDSNIWMGMILVFGFFTIGSLVSAQAEKPSGKMLCHICAGEIADEPYICPICKTTYHRPCAFSKAFCMTCQNPMLFPPPPP